MKTPDELARSLRKPERNAKGEEHPGFAAEAGKIERKEGVSKERADAILAAGARKASGAAKAANPALKKVKGA